MRILLIILFALFALFVLLFLIGSLLPRTHRATSRIVLQRQPLEVWQVVRNPEALLGTWKELKTARRLPDEGGHEVWEQDVGGFAIRLAIVETTPPARMVTRVLAPADAAFGGTWTYQLEPNGTGTRVSVTEDGWVKNPLFRVMMHLFGIHRSTDGYVKALGAKFGEQVKPEHVP